jgi:hypothetical protein
MHSSLNKEQHDAVLQDIIYLMYMYQVMLLNQANR